MTEPTTDTGAKTTPDDISQMLMADINNGILRRGEWLKQIDLERRYNCTRIKVRNALSYLHSQRLVEHIPNRGYRVPEPNPVREKEIGEVRSVLEAHAAADVVNSATEADIDRLQSLAEEFRDAAYNGTSFAQMQANRAFHAVLYGFCQNEFLHELILDMRRQGPAAPIGQWQTMAQLQSATQDHFDIVQAIRQRDLVALRGIIADHITGHINTSRQEIKDTSE
ncbi:GntR family transcriptional regulator [Rhodobacteraceae bacterium D3-12]|nr:GntR family transcriptional regulator [Rhodobacteraceae bacterium D3-12]